MPPNLTLCATADDIRRATDFYSLFFQKALRTCLLYDIIHSEQLYKVVKDNLALLTPDQEFMIANISYNLPNKLGVKLFKQYLEEGNSKDAPGNFPAWLYKIKPVYLYRFKGTCYDIGTVKVYNELNEKLSNNN